MAKPPLAFIGVSDNSLGDMFLSLIKRCELRGLRSNVIPISVVPILRKILSAKQRATKMMQVPCNASSYLRESRTGE